MPKSSKPNILVIWGDDIGISNLSCYSHGLMGYQTPNIDRLAKEGMMFTDSYGEQSCTAGRSSFITGQSVFRTGLSKVGIPAAHRSACRRRSSPSPPVSRTRATRPASSARTISAISTTCCRPTTGSTSSSAISITSMPKKSRKCTTTRTEKDFPKFRRGLVPRGVIHSWATDKDDPTEAAALGPVGKQKITDTGPLTKKRMETCDDEFVAAAKDFIKRQNDADTPFFVWLNTTHMHLFTHTKNESQGQAGRWQSPYHDTMIDHDKNVGQMLDYLDELGIADDTFVMYSTDNGPHMNTWPDGGMTPFRSEKNTNWEGAFRVPWSCAGRARSRPGQISNEIVQHHDWLPTFLAMAGDPDIVEKLKSGHQAIGRTYKNHIDGYNLLPYLTGEAEKSPRKFFMYFSDDGDVLGLRYDNWKVVFMEQRCHGTLQIWAEPFIRLRIPKIFNLRTDPYERADMTSNTYCSGTFITSTCCTERRRPPPQWAATFKDFPPIQKPNTFTLDDALKMMHETAAGMH